MSGLYMSERLHPFCQSWRPAKRVFGEGSDFMAHEHHERDAADKIKEARQLMPRVLFFALVVLMSHLLELQPSTVDAAGVKIAIKDTVVIRGGLALVFYYYFLAMLTTWMDGAYFFPPRPQTRDARNLIRSWKRRGWGKNNGWLTPAQVKKNVRSILNFRIVVTLPFLIARFYLIIVAAVVALPDVSNFGEFFYAQLLHSEGGGR